MRRFGSGAEHDALERPLAARVPGDSTDESLEAHFGDVGPVRRAYLVRDRKTQATRGFGFVSFALAEDAERAIQAYDFHASGPSSKRGHKGGVEVGQKSRCST